MNILIVNGGKSVTLDRPYLNKFSPNMTIENSVYIRECDQIDLTESEQEALSLLNENQYDSLIISTGGEVDGFYLLENIRQSNRLGLMPVTII